MDRVDVLVARSCGHCRRVAETVGDLCLAHGVRVAVTDLAEHPEAAEALGLEHSPIILADGRVVALDAGGLGRLAQELEPGVRAGVGG